MNWIADLFSNKPIEKEAEVINQQTEWDRKIKANDWIKNTLSIDEDQVTKEAELQQKAAEEVRGVDVVGISRDEMVKELWDLMANTSQDPQEIDNYLVQLKEMSDPELKQEYKTYVLMASQKVKVEKKAAYVVGDTQAETIEKDYELCVGGISNYHLAETLAEHILSPKGLATDPKEFSEEKAKQLKAVESDRKAAEKKLLDLIGEHTAVDWKKKFEEFKKAEVKHADGKELYAPEFEVGKQNWEKKEDWDKAPSDKERIEGMHGVGGEEKKNAIGDEKLLEEQRKEASLDKKADEIAPAIGKAPTTEHEDVLVGEDIAKDLKALIERENREQEPEDVAKLERALSFVEKFLVHEKEEAKHEASLDKKAYRTGDKIFYRGKPAVVKDIWMNPHSMEAIVVCNVDGEDLPIQDKELKQLSKEPLHERDLVTEPAKEDPSNRMLKEEIAPKASKSDVLKKIAEVSSPWVVTKDEQGNEVIAKVEQSTTTKESEEDKENLTSEGK